MEVAKPRYLARSFRRHGALFAWAQTFYFKTEEYLYTIYPNTIVNLLISFEIDGRKLANLQETVIEDLPKIDSRNK